MLYFAVPHKQIATQGKSSNIYQRSFFTGIKTLSIDMPQIVDSYNHTQQVTLFNSENDAIKYIKKKSQYDTSEGYTEFLSSPLLKVNADINITTGKSGNVISRDQLSLISGKMLFIGDRYVPSLPYRPCSDTMLSNSHAKLFSSEFDSRMAAIIFITFSTMGFLASEKITDDRSMSIVTGVFAFIAYIKWCNRSAEKLERIIDDEVNRFNNGTREQSQFNKDYPQESDSISPRTC